jgi:hypothetical protein
MKYEYRVLFQTNADYEKGRWLNGGMCYGNNRSFDTLEEAEACKNKIIEKCKSKNRCMIVNGIGITMEHGDSLEYKLSLRNIKIEKRQITEWEEV